VSDSELPADPDLDDLPPELADHPGPFTISAGDEHGNVWEGTLTKQDLAAAFAERRRADKDDAA
jgi:hypothetical protein